jgi:hydrogenase maturation protease
MLLADPMDLVAVLKGRDRVVLVDALLDSPPGRVVEASIDELSQHALQPVSSHGTGAVQAIRLARALWQERLSLRILAITVDAPDRYRIGLSPVVAAAIPEAVEAVLALLHG